MKIHLLKIFLLLVIGGTFVLGALFTYDLHPEETALWVAFSAFALVSFFLAVVLSFRLRAIIKDTHEGELNDER